MNLLQRIGRATKVASIVFKESRILSTGTQEAVNNHLSVLSDVRKIISGEGVQYQTEAYNTCPHVQAVIGRGAQTLINGNLMAVDSDGNAIEKHQGFIKAMKVLDKPNKYQSRSEFLRTIKTLVSVYGVSYVYKITPIGFSDISGLVCIPNTAITPMYQPKSDILSNQGEIIYSYNINLFGTVYILQGEDVKKIVEIRDSTINLSTGYAMLPKSKLDGLKYPISNLVATLESRNQMIVKRGADVLLSPESTVDKAIALSTLSDPEKKKIQSEYEKYGSLNGQWHALITTLPMKAQMITRSAQQLGLFEGEDSDFRTILRAYNTPATLMHLKDEAKYNTYAEAERDYIENAIIPDARIICEGFDNIFDSLKNGFRFYMDYSHLQCMQLSEKSKAEALNIEVTALNNAVASGLMDIKDAKNLLNDYLS